MRIRILVCITIFLIPYSGIISCASSLDTSYVFKKLTCKTTVRVVLKESDLTDASWSVACEGGFILYNPRTKAISDCYNSSIEITRKQGSFFANERLVDDSEFYILPLKGHLKVNSVPYDGFFCIIFTENMNYLVNHIDIEEYLASVLVYELVTSWPDEVQKAQCVAARSYTLAKIAQRHQLKKDGQWPYPFDLYSSTMDQVYKGHEKNVPLSRIVQETQGQVLTQEGKPIIAMYHAVCAGVVPGLRRVVPGIDKDYDFSELPYLKRPYACEHCKEQRYYRWKNTIDFSEIETAVKKLIPALTTIQEITITDYDAAGIGHLVTITDSAGKKYPMKSSIFRSLFYKEIRSICCTFTTKERKLNAEGKGFGHHIGMCQWGAYSMDLKGYNYKDILSYYYPGTVLTKLDALS